MLLHPAPPASTLVKSTENAAQKTTKNAVTVIAISAEVAANVQDFGGFCVCILGGLHKTGFRSLNKLGKYKLEGAASC